MINWILFIRSFFDKIAWLKNIRFLLGTGIIGLLILTTWRAYFVPRTVTKVIVEKGATYAPQPEPAKKKASASSFFHPFIETYGFAETDGRRGAGAKGGIRIEF